MMGVDVHVKHPETGEWVYAWTQAEEWPVLCWLANMPEADRARIGISEAEDGAEIYPAQDWLDAASDAPDQPDGVKLGQIVYPDGRGRPGYLVLAIRPEMAPYNNGRRRGVLVLQGFTPTGKLSSSNRMTRHWRMTIPIKTGRYFEGYERADWHLTEPDEILKMKGVK